MTKAIATGIPMSTVFASWAATEQSGGLRLGTTVRERVAQELRHRILFGFLPPQTRIDLDAIAEEFGTSRTPVREALLSLAEDRLVKVAPRSGITVLGITDADLLDNFAVMAVLAGMAAGFAAERATEQELNGIAEARDLLVQASLGGGDVVAANLDFHRRINQASHSTSVMMMIGRAARLFPERLSELIPEQAECSVSEHAEVVAALEARNSARARLLMEDHFGQAKERLRRLLGSGIRTPRP